MSARRTRGGDLKDSKEEEGEEAVAMAEAEATSEYDMVTRCDGADEDTAAVDVTWNAESSRDSKKRRVSTKEASIEFLECAKSSSEASGEVEITSPIDSAGGKSEGGAMQCGAAAGQASMSESPAHIEVSVDDTHANADGVGTLRSGESGGDAAVAVTVVALTSYKSVISSLARASESNPITAENYYLLHWLYRIRNVSCLRGLRISFLQPDFLWSIYSPMMRSKKLCRTDGDIRVAADLWCFDRAAAEERYGHISDWDVSSVTNMRGLFRGQLSDVPMQDRYRGKHLFNDDISRWDVSNVTNMSYMFFHAYSFNQPVGDWDVSKITKMGSMFYDARSFNQAVGDWDVSSVINMSGMFLGAESFNQPVGYWDVSNVTNMNDMFRHARAFNQPVGDWDVSKVTNMSRMFFCARSFNQPVGNWDVSKVTTMACMFCAPAFNQPVGDWDVSHVTNMNYMFIDAEVFNQDLTRWDMRSVGNAYSMFGRAYAMQRENKPEVVRDDVYDSEDEGAEWGEAEEEDDEGEWEETEEGPGV